MTSPDAAENNAHYWKLKNTCSDNSLYCHLRTTIAAVSDCRQHITRIGTVLWYQATCESCGKGQISRGPRPAISWACDRAARYIPTVSESHRGEENVNCDCARRSITCSAPPVTSRLSQAGCHSNMFLGGDRIIDFSCWLDLIIADLGLKH
jgi:hypothetical protein